MSRFEIGVRSYPKVGVSINNPRIKVVVGELASLCLFFVKITDDFLAGSKAENRGAFLKTGLSSKAGTKDSKGSKTQSTL